MEGYSGELAVCTVFTGGVLLIRYTALLAGIESVKLEDQYLLQYSASRRMLFSCEGKRCSKIVNSFTGRKTDILIRFPSIVPDFDGP